MKINLPPKLRYKTTSIDKTVKLATDISKDKKYVKMFYVDDKLFLEIPFIFDMRHAIADNLNFEFNILHSQNPLSLRGVDIRPSKVDSTILEKMELLEGQEKENSRERSALLIFHKEDEIKASLTNSKNATKLRNSAARNTTPGMALHTDKTSEAELDSFRTSSSTLNSKISSFFGKSGPSGDSTFSSRRDKIKKIRDAIRSKDETQFAKIKYNATLTMKKSVIDYSTSVPNSTVKNIDILNDRAAFGTRTRYYLGHPSNPGKRRSRSNKTRVLSKVKKGSEIKPGAAEKVYEKAEIDAFTEGQLAVFTEAEKITSKDQQTESSPVIPKEKESKNKFINSTNLDNQLRQNIEKEPKILEKNDAVIGSDSKSEISFLKGVESKKTSPNKNKSLRNSLGSDVEAQEKNLAQKSLKKKTPKSINAKYNNKRDMVDASEKLKLTMNSKSDPARYLKLQKPTHTSLPELDKPVSINKSNFEGSRYIKKSTNLMSSDPINVLSTMRTQTADEIISDEIIGTVLTEVPYELTYSEDNEDYDLVDQTEFSNELQNFPIVFSQNVSNRRQFVKHIIEVDQTFIENNFLHAKLIVKASNGIILNSIRYKFDMLSLRKQFLYPAPENTPALSVSNPDKNGDFTICLDNLHNTTITAKLFEKRYITGKNPDESKFVLKKTVDLAPDETYKINENRSRNTTSLYRMCYKTQIAGEVREFDNIILPTTVSETKNKNENSVTLYALQKKPDGITVTAKNLPLKTSAVIFKKRRLNFDAGNSPQKNANFKQLTYNTGEEVGFLNVINHNKGITILDKDVKDDESYQYIVELYSSSGTKISNSAIAQERFIRSKNLVDPSLKFKSSFAAAGTYVFKLELKQEQTEVEKIIKKFQTKEFELFKEKIDNLTKLIQQPPTADVFLINQKTGRQIKVGNFSHNKHITFSCSKNANYTILVKPISINPELLIDELNRLSKFNEELNIEKNSIRSKRKQAIEALRERQSREVQPFNKGKFNSNSATNKGIITDPATRAANFKFNLELDNYTGDNIAKSIFNIKKFKFGARPVNAIVRPSKFAHISFRAIGKTDKVDFYFVSTIKEGVQDPLTTVVAEDNKSVISFIDYSNENYFGRVDYYVQAVFQNGTISNLNYVGSCLFLQKGYL